MNKYGKFKLGQRVLVHQSGGIKLFDGYFVQEPHDCSDPSQHWDSRIVGWNEYQQLPNIATSAKRNPCHADWTYTEESLSELSGPDWADQSKFKPGDKVKFRWEDKGNLHYSDGSILDAIIEVAHIEPGDWYLSFPVPDGWRFKIVINEKDFL